MGDKKITDKIADATKTIFDTAKSVATSNETKAAFASAKETISRAVKSHGKKGAAAEGSNEEQDKAEAKEPSKEEVQESDTTEQKHENPPAEENKKEGE